MNIKDVAANRAYTLKVARGNLQVAQMRLELARLHGKTAMLRSFENDVCFFLDRLWDAQGGQNA
jgi:hypothetical protein